VRLTRDMDANSEALLHVEEELKSCNEANANLREASARTNSADNLSASLTTFQELVAVDDEETRRLRATLLQARQENAMLKKKFFSH
jgi:hypothetical protein